MDAILAQADELPPKEITNQIFDMLADFMQRELIGIEKIDFELSVLAINDPARVDKILKISLTRGIWNILPCALWNIS